MPPKSPPDNTVQDTKQENPADAREKRLADALRQNLLRRKAARNAATDE